MIVDIKLISDQATPPKRMTPGSACYDIFAAESKTIFSQSFDKISLGFALDLQHGYEAQIRPRSGLLTQGIVGMLGTIDSDYKRCIYAILYNFSQNPFVINVGDRIGQIKIEKIQPVAFNIVTYINDSGRGGFGSTGK